MLSGLIRVVACINTEFLFHQNNITVFDTLFYLFIHQLMDVWIVPLLAIINSAAMNSCVQVLLFTYVYIT
jgi:hypothetical protein